jgi:hypothetical protein
VPTLRPVANTGETTWLAMFKASISFILFVEPLPFATR